MMEQLSDISKEFKSALRENNIEEIEATLVKFDKLSRDVAEQDIDVDIKQEQLSACLKLHDEMNEALEDIKLEIQKRLANARSNGKKINKYLNVE